MYQVFVYLSLFFQFHKHVVEHSFLGYVLPGQAGQAWLKLKHVFVVAVGNFDHRYDIPTIVFQYVFLDHSEGEFINFAKRHVRQYRTQFRLKFDILYSFFQDDLAHPLGNACHSIVVFGDPRT